MRIFTVLYVCSLLASRAVLICASPLPISPTVLPYLFLHGFRWAFDSALHLNRELNGSIVHVGVVVVVYAHTMRFVDAVHVD